MASLAYGLTIDTDIDFDLPTVDGAPSLTVRRRGEPAPEVRWLTDTDSTGWRAGVMDGSDFVLAFDGRAEFTVTRDGAHVGWFAPGEETNTLVHLLLDHVVPMAISRQGRTVLHAAGLTTPGGLGYAVAGVSGAGKSTLAAALAAEGHDLFADDCVVTESQAGRAKAVPAYPGLRLSERSLELVELDGLTIDGLVTQYGSKRRVRGPAGWDGERRHELVAVFVLRDGQPSPRRTALESLGPAARTLALLPNSFRLNDLNERTVALDGITALAGSVDVFVLDNERTPAGLSVSVRTIIQTLSTAVGRD